MLKIKTVWTSNLTIEAKAWSSGSSAQVVARALEVLANREHALAEAGRRNAVPEMLAFGEKHGFKLLRDIRF
jgi:hypothetical protein